MSETATAFGEKEVLCCKMRTMLVGMNFLVGVAMILFGILNVFHVLFSIDGAYILGLGFFFF